MNRYKVLIIFVFAIVVAVISLLVWWFLSHPYGTPDGYLQHTPSKRRDGYLQHYSDLRKKINGPMRQSPLKYGITTIITTAPMKSIPSDHIIKETIMSLNLIPALKKSLVVIGFDGCPVNKISMLDHKCSTEYDCDLYKQYKANVKKMARELLPHVRFVELEERHCLSELVYSCMKDVDTTFVHVMQQDLPYIKTFDVEKLLRVMSNFSDMDLTRLSAGRPNKGHEEYTKKACGSILPQRIINRVGMTFTQCSEWSDQNHIAKISHYKDIVWDISKPYEFMEHQLLCYPADMGYKKIWYLGNPDDQFALHTDGRNSS